MSGDIEVYSTNDFKERVHAIQDLLSVAAKHSEQLPLGDITKIIDTALDLLQEAQGLIRDIKEY